MAEGCFKIPIFVRSTSPFKTKEQKSHKMLPVAFSAPDLSIYTPQICFFSRSASARTRLLLLIWILPSTRLKTGALVIGMCCSIMLQYIIAVLTLLPGDVQI